MSIINIGMKIIDAVYVFRMKETQELAWHERYHSHKENQYELHYFLEGKGTFLNNKTQCTIKAGQLYITPPRIYHSISHDNLQIPISYYAVLFELSSKDTELEELLKSKRLSTEEPIPIETKHRFFFEELKEKSHSDVRARNCSAKYKFLSFLYDLADNTSSYSTNPSSQRHIEKSLEIMQKSLFNQLTLGDLCKELELSEEYFIRLFKKYLKTTPMKYFTRLKIETSTALLCNSNKTIKEVAWRLGFANQFHFTKTFKKYTTLSPRAYRTFYKNAPASLPNLEIKKEILE